MLYTGTWALPLKISIQFVHVLSFDLKYCLLRVLDLSFSWAIACFCSQWILNGNTSWPDLCGMRGVSILIKQSKRHWCGSNRHLNLVKRFTFIINYYFNSLRFKYYIPKPKTIVSLKTVEGFFFVLHVVFQPHNTAL